MVADLNPVQPAAAAPRSGATSSRRPAFLITIDTECDNAWARTHDVTTRNSQFLPRFQTLCERYALKPTWLTNWEMANCPQFREFARDVLRRGTGEVGMHLHGWNSPPVVPLTEDDFVHHPYLIEYPREQMAEKVKAMTDTLEEVFGTKMLSHRAGRFGFDERYAQILIDNGYRVDCSVTPHVSWKAYPGDPTRTGGPDFSHFPEHAYFLDPADISRPGTSPLLEVPTTITTPHYAAPVRLARSVLKTTRFGTRVARHFWPDHAWFYPKGHNHQWLPGVLRAARTDGRDFVEFMIHSSELMPGGSPNFPTDASIEALYNVLERLFAEAAESFDGLTLSEYHDRFCAATGRVGRQVR